MTFTFKQEHEFDWKVDIRIPMDGGGHVIQRMIARFKVLPQSKTDEWGAQGDDTFLRRALIGWSEVYDTRNKPISFNTANRDKLIDVPYVRTALVQAYFRAISGERAVKN